jgi:hypothetical protein
VPVRDAIANIKRDPKWPSKIGIGLLVNLVPYVGTFALRGWLLDYERSVAWGAADGLPEWGDWVERAKHGLFSMLPGFTAVFAVSMVVNIVVTPLAMIPAFAPIVAAGPGVVERIGSVYAGALVFYAVLMVVSAVESAVLVPAMYVPELRYALYRDLSAAFQWQVLWRQMRAGGRAFRRAWVVSAGYLVVVLALSSVSFVPTIALQMRILTGAADRSEYSLLALAGLSFFPVFAVLVVLGIPASIVIAHLWAEWARETYGLDDQARATGIAEATQEAAAAEPAWPAPAPS